eukprot:1141906-Pelagomonas_calceolata.AAC.3
MVAQMRPTQTRHHWRCQTSANAQKCMPGSQSASLNGHGYSNHKRKYLPSLLHAVNITHLSTYLIALEQVATFCQCICTQNTLQHTCWSPTNNCQDQAMPAIWLSKAHVLIDDLNREVVKLGNHQN